MAGTRTTRTSGRPQAKRVKRTSDRRMKSLIYGAPKIAGKTHFLGTAAHDERTAPMAALDFEGGMIDVLETMPGWGTEFVHMPVASWEDLNEAYGRIEENDEGFKSVGIDSLSETHIFALMDLLNDGKPSRQKEPDLIQEGDYGIALVQLRRFTRMFRDLPLHVFYTSHSTEKAYPREGLMTIPSLAGKAAVEIPGLMTVVGYLTQLEEEGQDEPVRALLLQNYPRLRIGVRAPWGVTVPDEIYDPTVSKLLDAMQYDA